MENRRYKLGINREQSTFLPSRVEDYVSAENPVRAIDAYVESLDFQALGFTHSEDYSGSGQPAFSPLIHLKLYIWGYLNRVRSSRRLEAETKRNLELIWLLEGLSPNYHTICNFRRDNSDALQKVHREFVMLCKQLNLFGGELIGIDSVYLEGDASRESVMSANKLKKLLAEIDAEMVKYHKELDRNDTIILTPSPSSMDETLSRLNEKRLALKKMQEDLDASDAKQLSHTDKDARLLCKLTDKGPTVGYAVQGVVDSENKLIVTNEVTIDKVDKHALLDTVNIAKELLDIEHVTVLADGSYYSHENISQCEENGDELYVPIPDSGKQKRDKGKYESADFKYNKDDDSYLCPAGKQLQFRKKRRSKNSFYKIYFAARSTCSNCPLKESCLGNMSACRELHRSEHTEAVERLRKRMREKGKYMMKKRSGLVEHPFGTIKTWLGWTHFLVRGIDKVKGEMALITTVYNFKRVLNLIGIDAFIAACNPQP